MQVLYQFDVCKLSNCFFLQILFDNSNHDGKVPVTLNADGKVMDNCAGNSTVSKEGNDISVFEKGGVCMYMQSHHCNAFMCKLSQPVDRDTVRVLFYTTMQ